MRKRIFLLLVIILELAVIAFLAGKIYLKQSQVLGENISINPISKEDVVFPNQDSESDLKNFYEPKPNTNETRKKKMTWLPPDYVYTSTINADGLNERFDYSIEKDPNVFRIVTLGDSITFGAYVDTKDNYPERLEDLLNSNLTCRNNKKFEVINLGVGGYDIQYAVERFKRRGIKYSPDLVLWHLWNDDFSELREIEEIKAKQYWEQMIADGASPEDLAERGFYSLVLKARQELKEQISEQEKIGYHMAALQKLNDYYKGKLVFITRYSHGGLINAYMVALRAVANTRRQTYFYNELNPRHERLPDNAHPTGKGYVQIAGEIFDYLKQNGLVPCGSL